MKKLLLITAIIAGTSMSASAGDAKSAVTDARGNPVRSILTETCVRHDFNEGSDLCAPPAPAPAPVAAPAPAPAPAPEPVALLTKEELTAYFDFSKSSLNAAETAKLNTLVNALIASKGVKSLSIVGYADRIGSANANLALSKKRTAAVETYLNERVNIPTSVLQANSRGEEGSVTSCDKKQKRKALISCLAADRRVEIVLNYLR